jgi:hypothetical protein
MPSVISFHPVDLVFFDEMISRLLAGEKTNPEGFIDAALRMRRAAHTAQRYKDALETALENLEPPPPPTEGTVWEKVRARLERFDYKPDPVVRLIVGKIEPELHLYGRPFLVTEGSADRVAAITDEYLDARDVASVEALVIEQLVRVDPRLAKELAPVDGPELASDLAYRAELLRELKEFYDLALAARRQEQWGPLGGGKRSAVEVLETELPWRALRAYSRAVPYWVARDVDGLDTICRAADVSPPDSLVPARRLFADACEEFPGLRETLQVELQGPVGAYVAPSDVSEVLSFLNQEGSRIIQAASRHGEGTACATLLRKIRECAHYAERNGTGYVEAHDVVPAGRETDPQGEEVYA